MSSPKVKYGKYTESPDYSRTQSIKNNWLEKRNPKEPEDSKDNSSQSFFGINKNVYRKSDNWEVPKT